MFGSQKCPSAMVGTKFKVYMDCHYNFANVIVDTVIGLLVFIPLYIIFMVIVDAIQIQSSKKRR